MQIMSDLHVHLLLLVSCWWRFLNLRLLLQFHAGPAAASCPRSLIDFPTNENNCGFDGPNDIVPPDHCSDLGSFGGSQSGTQFKDSCNPSTTIDEIEVTVGLVGSSSMIRSIQTTYRYNIYSHGQPTNESYTMNFKQEKLYAIVAYTLAEKEGIKGVAFVAISFSLVCEFRSIGAKMITPDGWRTSERGDSMNTEYS